MTTINIADDWLDAVRASLGARGDLAGRLQPAVPAGYDELNDPSVAALDFVNIDALAGGNADVTTHLLQRPDGGWRFRIYRRGESIPLADMLPLLDQLGLRALDERAFGFAIDSGMVWLHDVGVTVPAGTDLTDAIRAEVQCGFLAEFTGSIEVDGLNRLILAGGLTARQIEILRAYSRYLRQIGFPFSQQYIEAALVRHASISRMLAALFNTRFDPSTQDDIVETETALRAEVGAALDAVPSLDDDRTLRSLLALIDATVRTNAFRPDDNGGHRPVLSFKFDTSMVPDLPLPRPMFEIWVCSPRVEGVHLRNGRIARGGIRWSDRREDFRTEILGLLKAQIVKNAVIVPTGAKGGFVLKKPPNGAEEFRAEGVACYREFISGLLDLTDNIVSGAIVPPPHTVRLDGDDAYFVVAADKGTATFSDIANEISAAYGYWLGDAFASGGSEGYDHKAMGITARGAWESVRRHARVLGKDADTDELTIAGIGDMSGDVFGNGMLRSPHIKLVAAFDHRHIFIDPDPDPAMSFAERKRLFELPRSSWANYDTSLMSAGGGVYPRTLKTIALSPEARKRLSTDQTAFTPHELVSAILRAPVDVLWNGGIGTYVKASTETHAEVGDRSNDGLRVSGNELRCRIVAEGGNLGLTQKGRIEYALKGGLVNTDAIDNSAGVDCSDHEVNIKILLGTVMAEGKMTTEQRNGLLQEMTDEVCELVLDDNRSQTLTLAIARRQALPMINVHARYLHVLEAEGWLNRTFESLPTDKQIAERQSSGIGLTHTRVRNCVGVHQERQHDRNGAHRISRRPVPRTRSRPLFPQGLAAAVSPRDSRPPTAPRDHRHAGRQPDGQPVGHLVRQPHDRRHRRGSCRRDACLGCSTRHLQLPDDVGADRGGANPRQARYSAGAVPRGSPHGRARCAVVAATPSSTARDRHRRCRVPAGDQRAVENTRVACTRQGPRPTVRQRGGAACGRGSGVGRPTFRRMAVDAHLVRHHRPCYSTALDRPRNRNGVLGGVRRAGPRMVVGCGWHAAAQ